MPIVPHELTSTLLLSMQCILGGGGVAVPTGLARQIVHGRAETHVHGSWHRLCEFRRFASILLRPLRSSPALRWSSSVPEGGGM